MLDKSNRKKAVIRMRNNMIWLRVASLGCVVLVVSGCSETPDGRIPVYPTTGQITVNGQPAAGVRVVMYGATDDLKGQGTVAPYAETDESGKFSLTSYDRNDGAPAGKFTVTAFWPGEIPPDADQEMYEPKDQLKEKYIDPKKSGLEVTVPEGGGELPTIDLKV